MLFESLIVLLHINFFLCTPSELDKQSITENNLKKLIINYYSYIDQNYNDNNSNEAELQYSENVWSTTLIEMFYKNFVAIFRQLSFKRQKELQEINNTIEKVNYNISKPTAYELKTCALIPKCLDFMLFFTKHVTIINILYRMHQTICVNLIMFILNGCNDKAIQHNSNFRSEETIRRIKAAQYTFTKYDNIYHNNDFENISAKFLWNMFNVVSTISNIALTYQNNLQTGVNIVAKEDLYKSSIFENTDAQICATVNSNEKDDLLALQMQEELTKRFKWFFKFILEEISKWSNQKNNHETKIPVKVSNLIQFICIKTPLIIL